MSKQHKRESSLCSELSEQRLSSNASDMAWHGDLPLRSRRSEGSLQVPSDNGSHVSLGNNRLAAPFNKTRVIIIVLVSTLVILLIISCATLGIVVSDRKKSDNELQYIRSMLDEHLQTSRGAHDDPPVQHTAPVAYFEGGNPPTSNIPSMSPSVMDDASNSPSGETRIESLVPTGDEPPTASPMAVPPPTESPTASPIAQETPSPVEEETPAPVDLTPEEETPAPTGKETPAPVEAPSSPVVEETPAPVEDETPQPIEVQTPAPAVDESPQPVEPPTSTPVEEETPQPIEAQTPAPAVDESPQPVEPPTSTPVEEETPQPIEAQTPAPAVDESPQPVEPPTSTPVEEETPQPIEAQTPAPVVDETDDTCDEEYFAFLQCQDTNSAVCGDCDTNLQGGLNPEEECNSFNIWFENNVFCCTDDECGFELDAIATCKDCPQFVPSSPFAAPFSPFAAPVEAPRTAPTPSPNTWTQVGQSITWNSAASDEATSLSMSRDGTTVAVGQFDKGLSDQFGGQVDVYSLGENGVWSPVGQTIESDLTAGSFGYTVSLNEDGTVLAISDPDDGTGTTGRVVVYELLVDTWVRRGQILDGGGPDQFAGGGVVLSDDGTVILYDIHITSRVPGPTKFVRVFRYNGSTWEKVGQDVFGQTASLADAFCIDLSGDGNKFAFASTVPGFGYAETYQLAGNTWEKYGEVVPDSMTTDESVGLAVSLDENGDTLAVGFRKFQMSNIVRAYGFDDEWVQLGVDIDSEGSASSTTMTIDLSSDGQTLAIGPQDDTKFASVHSYDISIDQWSKVGENIDADSSTTGFELRSVSLADTGPRVSVFGSGGEDVRVYDAPTATARK